MILSVSRRTDVPNYYSAWFLERVKEGYLYVRNPMNHRQLSKIIISPETVEGMVFWTKNPAAMLPGLCALREYPYYFQFTLTGYGRDVEPGLPDKKTVLIPVFKKLSGQIGSHRVIWRYDPVFVNHRYTMEYHERAFSQIAKALEGYTHRVVISFLDVYEKTRRNMRGILEHVPDETCMRSLAGKFAAIASAHRIEIQTCAEEVDLSEFGISHGSCIDARLLEAIGNRAVNPRKASGQRGACGCCESRDVGTYHTCRNGCRYCYANDSEKRVMESIKNYDVHSPILCGRLTEEEKYGL